MAQKNSFLKKVSDITGIERRAAFTGVGHGAGRKNAFLKLAARRYSCRVFSEKPVSGYDVDSILEAARLAPTAVNRQPVHVWAVESAERREALKAATPYTFDAPVVFIVACRPEDAWVRKYDDKNGAEIDAAIVGTHIMMQAEDIGLGTTWVGSFDPAKLLELFPELEGWTPVALFPVGHPAGGPSERHALRKSLNEISTRL